MKAYSVFAAALAAFAIASLQTTPSTAAPATAAEKPLQLTQPEPSAQPAAKSEQRKRTRATRRAPEKSAPAATEAAAAEPAVERDIPLPVVKVRTTRETNNESGTPPVVQADELSEIDQAAAPSLVAAMIVSYLGGPANIEESGDTPPANTEEFPEEAKQAFAAEAAAPKATEVALEYILMTFGGALAAASAIRLFVV